MSMPIVEVTDQPLDLTAHEKAVADAAAGAVVSFHGVVRDHDHGRTVSLLEYEGHPSAADVLREVAAEIAADPQVWANGYLIEVEHPEWGRQAVIGSPIRFSDTPAHPGAVAPELGQHTEEVLLEAGYTWEEIADLRERGAW